MSVHLSEQEQLEELKQWWKEYGTLVITSVLAAVAIYFAYTTWQERQRIKADTASASYDALVKVVQGAQMKPLTDAEKASAEKYVAELKEKNGGSYYAQAAALLAAKMAIDKNELDKAIAELKYVLDQKPDASVKAITQLRLARVYLAKGDVSAAQVQLTEKPAKAFASEYSEVEGDMLSAKGDKAGALAAYEKANTELATTDQQRSMLLQMKIDAMKSPAINTAEKAQ